MKSGLGLDCLSKFSNGLTIKKIGLRNTLPLLSDILSQKYTKSEFLYSFYNCVIELTTGSAVPFAMHIFRTTGLRKGVGFGRTAADGRQRRQTPKANRVFDEKG